MEYGLILLGIICTIIGVIGCIFPAIPGPPLSYAALILLQFAKEEPVFSNSFLVRFAVLTVVVSLGDYFLPLLGAKKYGTSKYGKENSMALKAGLATFIGSMTAVLIKLSLSVVMAFIFFTSLFKG